MVYCSVNSDFMMDLTCFILRGWERPSAGASRSNARPAVSVRRAVLSPLPSGCRRGGRRGCGRPPCRSVRRPPCPGRHCSPGRIRCRPERQGEAPPPPLPPREKPPCSPGRGILAWSFSRRILADNTYKPQTILQIHLATPSFQKTTYSSFYPI